MKRRDFLKTGAGLGAAVAVNRLLGKLPENMASAGQSGINQNRAESSSASISQSTIFELPESDFFPYGWVSGAPLLCLLADGTLAVAFERMTPRPDAGSPPCYISKDQGGTWSALEELPAGLARIVDVKRPYHPAAFDDGTQLDVDLWAWADWPESARQKLSAEGRYIYDHVQGNRSGVLSVFYDLWMARSDDAGKTWAISELSLPNLLNWGGSWRYGEGLVLRDGSFIKPFWGRYGLDDPPQLCSSVVLRTEDRGHSWNAHLMVRDKSRAFTYSCITEAADGSLVGLVQPLEQDRLWTCFSTDGGRTWSPHTQTAIRGGNPWIITTTDGLLVMTYARENPKVYSEGTGVFACLSRDNGHSWDVESEITIWDNQGQGILTMPAAVALPDGSAYVVYALQGRVLTGARFNPHT